MMGYIAQENLNIRIHKDIAGDMWFGGGGGGRVVTANRELLYPHELFIYLAIQFFC